MFSNYIKFYQDIFKNNPQIINKTIGATSKKYFYIFYNDQMIDKKLLNYLISPILNEVINKDDISILFNSLIDLVEISKFSIEDIEKNIYSGALLIYCFKTNKLYSINIQGMMSRTPNIDSQEIVYSGSKDSLIESLDVNLSLIYKKIKTSLLINKEYQVGDYTKTKISLLYFENEIDKNMLNEIQNRLNKIKAKALTSIGDLATHLFNNANFVPLFAYTSKVDLIEQALINGKAVIIIDGIPEGIILPISLFNFGSFDDAINESIIVTIFSKIFSIIGIFISIFLLGLYTSIVLYEPDLIPYTILINVFNAYKGVSLSGEIEIIITYLFFQIFLQAGNKSLSGLSQSILIIGSLLIGQIAVSSGFISQITLIIVAISLFSCYIISNNITLNISFMFLQLISFISSILFGFIGYLVSTIMILIYLNSLESISVPFLYPFSHLNFSKIKEALFSSTYIKKKGNNK